MSTSKRDTVAALLLFARGDPGFASRGDRGGRGAGRGGAGGLYGSAGRPPHTIRLLAERAGTATPGTATAAAAADAR